MEVIEKRRNQKKKHILPVTHVIVIGGIERTRSSVRSNALRRGNKTSQGTSQKEAEV